jgi:hypothetical protein
LEAGINGSNEAACARPGGIFSTKAACLFDGWQAYNGGACGISTVPAEPAKGAFMAIPIERRAFLTSALLGLPAALLPLRAAMPLASGRRLTRAEQEEFLRNAEITKTHGVSEGITNTRRATLTDGVITHDAQIQSIDQRKTSFTDARGTYLHFADSFKHNIAAYELDKILDIGMIPPSVERVVTGQTSAVTWWVDDVQMTEKQRYQKKITPPNQAAWNRQIYCVRTFDELIYNFDRNLGNLVITNQWRIWMIDHTRAFLPYQKLNDAKRLVQCDRHLLAAMRGLTLEKVQKGLGRYLEGLRIAGLMARRDAIVAHFEQQIKLRGEEQVLYNCLPFETVVEVPVATAA